MWNWVTYALFIVLGWYLYPFAEGSRIRNAINAMIGNLIRALVAMLQQHEQRKASSPKKNAPVKAQAVASTPTRQTPTPTSIPPIPKNVKLCKCGGILAPIQGMAGSGYCLNCSTVQPMEK